MISRNVAARGLDAGLVAKELGEKLVASDLVLVVVFADWRIDPAAVAHNLQQIVGAVPVVGCTTLGVLGGAGGPEVLGGGDAVALGLYGTDVRVGIGVAAELSKHTLARSREAVDRAAEALGTRSELLDPARHVLFALVESSAAVEESFCIGAATVAPQIRMVGGFASTELDATGLGRRAAAVWANGEALADAGVIVLLETTRPFEVIMSSHLVTTDLKTVVTAANGRTISELDGVPAARRFTELIGKLGGSVETTKPINYTFARMIDGVPYVRSIGLIEGELIHLGSAIDAGHVLRIMKTGDLVGQTARDLAAAAERLGGISALLAFSCVYRDWEANERGLAAELAAVYAAYPTTGLNSFGEQAGMLFVNHTLTALAIGVSRGG